MPWKWPSNRQNEKTTLYKRWLFHWSSGVLEEYKFQITKTEVSGFSVQVSVFLFFFPDT